MKQLTNNKTTINKEINYSPVIAMEIKTLDDTFMFSYSTNIIDFYIDTLKNYLPLNGINTGIDKISTTVQQELFNVLYYPIKNELFNKQDALQEKHLDDFNEIFVFLTNGNYFDYNFNNAETLIKLINAEINRLFIRIAKNRIKKRVYAEIQDNKDCFILDSNNINKLNDIDAIVNNIKDCSYTQLLTFVFHYDSNAINYNLDSLHKIVMDLKKLASTKKYTKFIKDVVQFELKAIKKWKEQA
tara:strand:- start:3517 stop:4245 length:729 start_codon:yes stop_codon:yes gene_type:complete